MRVLVTGGLGFIGSNFIHLLEQRDSIEVIYNIDSMSYGSSTTSLDGLLHDSKYKFVKGNIADPKAIRPLISQVDTVVNFAAETHVDRSISSGESFVRSNIVGVSVLLDEVRKSHKEVTFLQVGTDEEYGEVSQPAKESDTLKPSSPYAASKASASLLVLAYARTYGLKARVTRCTNNYGPYQFPEKLIPKSIVRAHMGLRVPVYGDGLNSRDWIYVEDHCEALYLVMRRGEPGTIYNVAGRSQHTNIEVIKAILRFMKRPPSLIEYVADRPGHDREYKLDDGKIRRELGWTPTRKFEAALRETVMWYLRNQRWWRPLVDQRILSSSPWKMKWGS